MFMATNTKAATKRATDTAFSSANSFINTPGSRSTPRHKTQHALFIPKLASSSGTSGQIRFVITAFIMSPNTLKKITNNPKLLTRIMKQIQKIEDLPMTRKPISNIDEGVSGQTSLAFRKRTLLSTT